MRNILQLFGWLVSNGHGCYLLIKFVFVSEKILIHIDQWFKILISIFFSFLGLGSVSSIHKYRSISARKTLILGNYIEVRTVLFDDWIEGREGHPGTGC